MQENEEMPFWGAYSRTPPKNVSQLFNNVTSRYVTLRYVCGEPARRLVFLLLSFSNNFDQSIVSIFTGSNVLVVSFC